MSLQPWIERIKEMSGLDGVSPYRIWPAERVAFLFCGAPSLTLNFELLSVLNAQPYPPAKPRENVLRVQSQFQPTRNSKPETNLEDDDDFRLPQL